MIGFRGGAEIAAALDAAAAADPEKPSRSELIRRIVTDWLRDRARLAKASAKAPGATAPAVAEKAARAHPKAASAADEALSGIEAPAEAKAARRNALTEKPAMVAKARTKGLPR